MCAGVCLLPVRVGVCAHFLCAQVFVCYLYVQVCICNLCAGVHALPVYLDIAAVQGHQAVGCSSAGARRGALQHLDGVPVAHQNPLTAQVRLHLHQLIQLRAQRERALG